MNKNKVLVVTTVASTVDQFCMNDINVLLKLNNEVHILANFQEGNNTSIERLEEFRKELINKGIIIHDSKLKRNPISIDNLKEYKKIKKIINKENFNMIHCHTPIASIITRIAARKNRKLGTKVVYTAHGFHFFKGASIINWILYYPIERFYARYTDILITINKEDYKRAKRFNVNRVEYLPGVGIDTKKISSVVVNKELKRKEIGVPDDAFLVLSVGELNNNKNHETIIKAIAKLKNPNIYYVICGQGILESHLKSMIDKFDLRKQVKLLGYRSDIIEICKASDVFAFPSKREGLGLAALEAMACGLPILTSNIHGIRDYSINGITGYYFKPTDVDGFSDAIKILENDRKNIRRFMENNIEEVKKFDIINVKENIEKIYSGM